MTYETSSAICMNNLTPCFSKIVGYNGHAGPFTATVNMGPVQPPQRKGRCPQYARDKLVELQEKFNDLEAAGVFRRPEDIGVVVEYRKGNRNNKTFLQRLRCMLWVITLHSTISYYKMRFYTRETLHTRQEQLV